jgi:16S rRNA (guanine527-N7)-methyltransferase
MGLNDLASGGAVDKNDQEALVNGAVSLGVTLAPSAALELLRLRAELLRWNAKVDLTAITDPAEVLEKHFLDSLAVAPNLPDGATVLDAGTGAGFPGLPLALARPDLRVTLVDSSSRRVAFCKQMVILLGLGARVTARDLRLTGHPEREGLSTFDVAVSRAVAELPAWLRLAAPYVRPGGAVIAMLGPTEDAALRAAAESTPLQLDSVRRFALPASGGQRTVAVFRRA